MAVCVCIFKRSPRCAFPSLIKHIEVINFLRSCVGQHNKLFGFYQNSINYSCNSNINKPDQIYSRIFVLFLSKVLIYLMSCVRARTTSPLFSRKAFSATADDTSSSFMIKSKCSLFTCTFCSSCSLANFSSFSLLRLSAKRFTA